MTDFVNDIHLRVGSVPSSPTHTALKQPLKGEQQQERTQRLEELREQLVAAKIPVSKRASVCELPQSADDCQFVSGTTRCSLSLCEDSCAQAHRHHRSHAKPLSADAPLIFSRPSIIASNRGSVFSSPADSLAPSTNTSPQQQYRRASTFGFGLGSHRGSVVAMPDVISGPPSPLSNGSSAHSSAANSPRQRAPLMQEHVIMQTVPAAAASAAAVPAAAAPAASAAAAPSEGILAPHLAALHARYLKLKNRLVNLADYRDPAAVGSGESRTRTDLAAAPRDDWIDQAHAEWDPRSPQPPSPFEGDMEKMGPLTGVNLNAHDQTKPPVELVYEQRQ